MYLQQVCALACVCMCAYRCGVSPALALGDVRRARGGDPPALGGVLGVVMGAGVQRAGGG